MAASFHEEFLPSEESFWPIPRPKVQNASLLSSGPG